MKQAVQRALASQRGSGPLLGQGLPHSARAAYEARGALPPAMGALSVGVDGVMRLCTLEFCLGNLDRLREQQAQQQAAPKQASAQ
jgi:hypothetical protein